MAETVLRQVRLTDEEDARLRQRAHDRGLSEEDLIRQAVQQVLGDESGRFSEQEHEQARLEWAQVMALMRARAALQPAPIESVRGRGWTREQAYDERFDRRAR